MEAPRAPLPPVVSLVGAGLTVASAAVLTWSGVDTLSARDAYVTAPTEAGYRDGVSREVRTNALVGVTAALGVATLVTAVFFTDWSPRRGRALSVAVSPMSGGAAAAVLASF